MKPDFVEHFGFQLTAKQVWFALANRFKIKSSDVGEYPCRAGAAAYGTTQRYTYDIDFLNFFHYLELKYKCLLMDLDKVGSNAVQDRTYT